MAFSFTHVNFNVLDLARSMAFYEKAFGFHEKRRLEAEGFTLVYLTDGTTDFELELTYLDARTISGKRSSISRSIRMTMPQRMHCIRRWGSSATRMRKWASISWRIPTATGLKFSQKICDEQPFFVYNRIRIKCSWQRGSRNGKAAGTDRGRLQDQPRDDC